MKDQKSIIQQEEILCLITQRTSERSIEYRSLIPKTMYHLASSFDSLRTSITKKLRIRKTPLRDIYNTILETNS